MDVVGPPAQITDPHSLPYPARPIYCTFYPARLTKSTHFPDPATATHQESNQPKHEPPPVQLPSARKARDVLLAPGQIYSTPARCGGGGQLLHLYPPAKD